jgi:N-acetylmuramoyl-L-alanine amidase
VKPHFSLFLGVVVLIGTGLTRVAVASPLPLPSPAADEPFKVFIDVGHGGKDRGARGLFGIQESDLCLDIGKKVVAGLIDRGKKLGRPLEFELSRESDVYIPLRERVDAANAWGADLFVSIHANSAPTPLAHGFEVYFMSADASDEAARRLARSENKDEGSAVNSQVMSILSDAQSTYHVQESSLFAESLFQSMARRLTPNIHGVRQAPFTVLAGTEMPSVLIEVGYVNHIKDAKNLAKQDYLKRLADAISTGIIEFIRNKDQSKRSIKRVG